jgi:hypothetical protein
VKNGTKYGKGTFLGPFVPFFTHLGAFTAKILTLSPRSELLTALLLSVSR